MATHIATVCFAIGAFFSVSNFYLAVLRPIARRLVRRECQFVSVVPIFGSLMLVIAYFLTSPEVPWRPAALVIAAIDLGRIHWFLGMLLLMRIRDQWRLRADKRNSSNRRHESYPDRDRPNG